MNTKAGSYSSSKNIIKNICDQLKNSFPDMSDHLDSIIKEMEKEIFHVTVIAHWSHGKSTFLNALMKEKLLYSPRIESTCRLTKIVYGSQFQFTAFLESGETITHSFEDVEQLYEALREYTDLRGKQNKDVKYVNVKLPLPLCADNVCLVDTPGVKSASRDLEAIAKGFVYHSDLIIFIFDQTAPGDREDWEFIEQVKKNEFFPKEFIFVINNWDLRNADADSINVLDDFRNRLIENTGYENPAVFPVSSLYELQGQRLYKYKSENILREPESEKISFVDDTGKRRFIEDIEDYKYLLRDSGFEPFRNAFHNYLNSTGRYQKMLSRWSGLLKEEIRKKVITFEESMEILTQKKSQDERVTAIKDIKERKSLLVKEKANVLNQLRVDLNDVSHSIRQSLFGEDRSCVVKFLEKNIIKYKEKATDLLKIDKENSTGKRKITNFGSVLKNSFEELIAEVNKRYEKRAREAVSRGLIAIRDLAPDSFSPHGTAQKQKMPYLKVEPDMTDYHLGLDGYTATAIVGVGTAVAGGAGLGLTVTTTSGWWLFASATTAWNPIGWALAAGGALIALGAILARMANNEKKYKYLYNKAVEFYRGIIFGDLDRKKYKIEQFKPLKDAVEHAIKQDNKNNCQEFEKVIDKILGQYNNHLSELEKAWTMEKSKLDNAIASNKEDKKALNALLRKISDIDVS